MKAFLSYAVCALAGAVLGALIAWLFYLSVMALT